MPAMLYGQRVRITAGFYAGCEGMLYEEMPTEQMHHSEARGANAYSVLLDGDEPEATGFILEFYLERIDAKKKTKPDNKVFKIAAVESPSEPKDP